MRDLHRPKVLVTGGAGFIGSHTVVELWEAGFQPIILDNFSNSHPWMVDRIKTLTSEKIKSYNVDCANYEAVCEVVKKEKDIHGIIHFAAFKAVGDSIKKPKLYHANNMGSLKNMLRIKTQFQIPDFVFSSSATVYGEPDQLPVTENSPLQKATSPYGETKQLGEELILETQETGAVILRYFNPIGAHPSGIIGELPIGVPQNLVPYLMQTAMGIRDALHVFGTDYTTPDGSAIRDYIHVVDLAKAHVAALKRLYAERKTAVYNIGTGKGNSVLEVIKSFTENIDAPLNVIYSEKRSGDISAIYADVSKANFELDWRSQYSVSQALRHAWQWELNLKHNFFMNLQSSPKPCNS